MKAPPAFLLLTVLVCLGATGPALADVYTWTANQNRGPQWDCAERAENAMWKISETDDAFVMQSDALGRMRINARHLNPDGSGRVEFKDTKGKPMWVEFDAGHGPRNIRFNSGYHACVWTLEPIFDSGTTAQPAGKFDGVALTYCGQTTRYSITLPGGNVPAQSAAFVGVWTGSWVGGRCSFLIVESVAADGATMGKYGYGALGNSRPEMRRISGRITNGLLYFQLEPGINLNFSLSGTAGLAGEYNRPDDHRTGWFKRGAGSEPNAH